MSVLGFLGTRSQEECETDTLPAEAPRGKVAERVLAAELLQEMRRMNAALTETMERVTSGVVNHVLAVETRTMPTDGRISRSFSAPMGSIEVNNLGSNDMTVVAGADGGISVPTTGVGVYVVPAGSARLVNVAGRGVTIWGTSGDRVSFQAFTTGGISRPALGSIDGGGV